MAERWQKVTGTYLSEGYGLTETSPIVCFMPLGTAWDGTVGFPIRRPGVDPRQGIQRLPVWTSDGDIGKHTGEITIRGPQQS